MRNSTEKIFISIVFLLLSFFVSLLISLRPDNLTPDYYNYELLYSNPDLNSEIIFSGLRVFFNYFNLSFPFFLFFFSFVGLYFKLYNIAKFDSINILLFILFYFICFFPLWEITQIRIAMAMGFFFFALLLEEKDNRKIPFFLLACLCHYSVFFLVFSLFIHRFFGRKLFLTLFLTMVSALLVLNFLAYTSYNSYDVSDYKAAFNPFSFKNLMLLILIFYCLKYHYRDNVFVQYAVVASMSLLIYYLVLGERYPAVVIRLSDIAVFLTVSTFILLRNTHLNFIIKVILLFFIMSYYSYVNYFSSDSLVNISVLRVIFSRYM